MKKIHKLLIIMGLLLSCVALYGQKTDKVEGTFTYIIPENVSYEQAKKIAIEQAKIKALADKYGTIVSQTSTMHIQTENEKSTTSFSLLGGTEVKGEWLGDRKEPEISRKQENGMDKVTAKVWGEAREITSAGIDFSSKILNHPDAKRETDIFKHGENFYISFRSPVDGYLVVYLYDGEETVYRILPEYGKDGAGNVEIEGGKDYTFLKDKKLEFTCEKLVEHNHFFIIFSDKKFIKANDENAPKEAKIPNTLTWTDFQKWFSKNRQMDKNMERKIISVTIEK